jgi:hypothetical protein
VIGAFTSLVMTDQMTLVCAAQISAIDSEASSVQPVFG